MGSFIDKYKVLDFIGEGRFGICYLVSLDEKQYILKEIKRKFIKKDFNKVKSEGEILSTLDNPFIPKIIDVIENEITYACVLEYIKGKTVEEVIFEDKYVFSLDEIYKIGIKIINIVKYLHSKNIVHRDIRVPNVILNENNVYLVDFGLARFINNKKYRVEDDFSYIGHLLLHLYYTSYESINKKSRPWYEELTLSLEEKMFLKRLLGIDEVYKNIYDLERDFLNLENIMTSKKSPL